MRGTGRRLRSGESENWGRTIPGFLLPRLQVGGICISLLKFANPVGIPPLPPPGLSMVTAKWVFVIPYWLPWLQTCPAHVWKYVSSHHVTWECATSFPTRTLTDTSLGAYHPCISSVYVGNKYISTKASFALIISPHRHKKAEVHKQARWVVGRLRGEKAAWRVKLYFKKIHSFLNVTFQWLLLLWRQ